MRILSLGAGVQSTTLYLTEEWDYAIFADTQEEPAPVYRHLEWLQTLARAPILVRTIGKLGDHLMRGMNPTRQRFASIPAFTLLPDRTHPSRTRRQCTREYKLDVIHQCIRKELLGLQPRQRFPKSVRISQGIGFSADERHRAGRALANWTRPQIMPVFPLIERGWDRERCKAYLKTVVPHEVPRSSCVFCPFHQNEEWRWLRDNDPAGWGRAIQIDRILRTEGVIVNRGMDAEMFVHRSCVPLEQANIEDDSSQLSIDFESCTGGCAG